MCNAIFMTGLPVHAMQDFPPFHNLAMLGGAMWCTGNMLCGPVINLIGLSMGLLIWGSFNMICGWASGTFGLFGLQKDEVAIPVLNYAGIAVALLGLAVYLQVESTPNATEKKGDGAEGDTRIFEEPLLSSSKAEVTTGAHNDRHQSHEHERGRAMSVEPAGISMPREVPLQPQLLGEEGGGEGREDVFGSSWPPVQKRTTGIAMAAVAGALFGTSFNPAQSVIDSKYDGDDSGLNYVFPHFCGILVASWAYTMLYFTKKYFDQKTPFVNPDCILPATVSGIMWGVADIAWFVANGELGFSVSFPVIATGPGFLGALWGIFLFKEISGTRNFLTLAIAFFISVSALIMIAAAH
jgi:glucose uptake protein GlcU